MHFIKKFGVFLIDTGRQKLHNKQSTENCIWMRDSYLPAAKQKQRRRQMVVRKAISQDIDRIMEIYARAKIYMNENGNPGQWINGYPAKSLIESDIEKGQSFVCEAPDTKEIYGVFAFILGEDPTYKVIEGGQWLNQKPYGTIHRIGSAGRVKGIFAAAMDFCMNQVDNLRIDTHANNLTMQHLVEKHGFQKCGTIYVHDGSPRIAYHFCKANSID